MERKRRKGGYFLLSVGIMLCLMMASILTFYIPNNKAEAVISTSPVVKVEELLQIGYEDKAEGAKIFNADNLSFLYEKLSGQSGATLETIKDLGTQTAENFRDKNKEGEIKKDIVVKLGGFEWTVVYLTQAGDNVVLDLWLADDDSSLTWNDNYDTTSNTGNYPSNMYGTSRMRAVELNNGGAYWKDASTLTAEHEQSAEHRFSIFTMSGIKGSITDYILTPEQAIYQGDGTLENSAQIPHTSGYTASGDCFNKITEGANWVQSGKFNYESKPGYDNWKRDLLWLPSVSEVGDGDGINGIWKVSFEQKKSSQISWLRTPRYSNVRYASALNTAGKLDDNNSVDTMRAVRPALHLNLSMAESNSLRSLDPQDCRDTYTGNPLTPEKASWYSVVKKAVEDGDVTETYYKDNQEMTSAPINAGTYTIKYEIKPNAPYMWSDQSTGGARTITFTIDKKELVYPTVSGSNTAKYNGSQLPFYFNDFESDKMTIAFKSNYDDVSVADDSALIFSVSAKNAGTYELEATLKDQDNYKWKSRSKIEIQINPAQIIIESIGVASGVLETTYAEDKYVDVRVDAINGDGVMKDDTVSLSIYIIFNGKDVILNDPNDSAGVIELIAGVYDNYTNRQLKTSILPQDTTHALKIKTDNGNYEVSLKNEITLSVMPEGKITNLQWTLKDGKDTLERKTVELSDSEDKTFDGEYVYSGREYTVEARYPDTYTLDTSYGNNGYLLEKVSGQGNVAGVDAGTYRMSIKLSNGQIYGIVWTIDPYKFDLTNVKWQNNGKVEYTGSQVSLTLDNLPDGLIAQTYERNTGTNVDSYGPATVHFGLASGYDVNNYIIPIPTYTDNVADSVNPDTYIGSFEWEKEWEITQAIIKVGKGDWKNAQNSDEANPFSYKVLSDPRAEGVVEYVYYETDRNGNPININNPLDLSDITVSATEKKSYIAVPSIKAGFENNYKFPDGLTDKDKYSPVFEIGGGSTAVEVRIDSDKIEYYNGKPRNVKLVITGSAKESDLTVTYYKGDIVDEANRLEGAPTEVGKYLAVITSNNPNVILSGTKQYEFEITQSQVGKEWNKNYKPYVLNLKYGQINGVKYEIRDKDGNVIEDISQLTVGNSYEIRALIKDGNYIFADGSTETDWETFEVREGDQLFDPNSPNNPNYPQNDPEDGNKPGDGDNKEEEDNTSFDKVLKVIKEWWQVVASGISIILIIVFTAKGIGYASKRKENKKTIESRYKTYYATGLFGLSMTKWTIMAGVFMGAAVIAFVFMLIEKRGYKKSVRELDEARDEYERSENKRRDEDMKMMLMHMMGGGNMNGAGGQVQGGYVYDQPALGAEEMRVMINDAVMAMLPNMQQYLPQQASTNDEIVQRLIEQNEQLMEQNSHNEERIEMLMKKLSEQPAEKAVEREVAATIVNDDMIKELQKTLKESLKDIIVQPTSDETILKVISKTEENDGTIKQLLKNQELLMKQIIELSANKAQPQVIEKIVEKPVRVEVPVEVEKIVEKEVKVEVPVEKVVVVPAVKPTAQKKAVAPRLTLDEAYEKLSKQQKKFFDTLKAYAMSKDKCKEKKSTYYILLGQSSVNPLVKLTIKKDTTVALFKMEDEYFKDIRRNAGSDGTKIKVKETELIVGDAQALDAAKEMIDLREDQIERYQEYLKEQKSMKR